MIVPGGEIRRFRIREPHRARLLELPVHWGHGGLSEVTFRRTYSRTRPDGTSEDWNDCVVRVIEGMFSILRTHAMQNRIPWREERGQRLALEAAQRMQCFKWTPPGRGLWMMGTDYVYERGGMSLNNCAFVSTQGFNSHDEEETIDPFRFLMDTAMLGVGPGFDTLGAGKIGIRGFDHDLSTVTHVVQDSREGWVDATGLVIRNALFNGPRVSLDVRLVRTEGELLRGFGGVASGPRPLVQGLMGISELLTERQGRDICSVTITDLMNLIGKIVVAGNVRRTAEIGFSVPGDAAFAGMKDWRNHPVEMGCAPPQELAAESLFDYEMYQEHQLKPHTGIARRIVEKYADRSWAYKFGGWRWSSNNSVLEKVGGDYRIYNDSIASSGEPGFAWLELAREYSRMKDPPNGRDHRVMGTNPCFTGDTLVWTAEGHRTFSELADDGRDVSVLTQLESGRLAYRTMRRPRKTQKAARICVVRFLTKTKGRSDEITSVNCTPNHVFYLTDGRQVEAQNLQRGHSIQSAYRHKANSKGYMRIGDILEHHIPFEGVDGLGSTYHIHHKNEVKWDNTPSNLELMEREHHNSLNMAGDNNPIRKWPECNASTRRDVTIDRLKELQDSGLDVYQMAEALGCSRHTVSRRLGLYGKNHTVVSVEMLEELEDVYCGTVDETSRFFIALGKNHGVLVHNCGEQSLESYEICNLVENYPSHAEAPEPREAYDSHEDWARACYWDFQRTLKFSYLYSKTVTLMGTHWERTNEVIIRNRRIGCSLCGVSDAVAKVGRTHFFTDWCERGYQYIGYLDKKYSDWLGVRESIKRTSIKPSGTVSLVAGIRGPGGHFPKRTGYRTMRISRGSPLVTVLETAGYRVEPSVTEPAVTVVAYFPWIVPPEETTEEDIGLWEQVKQAADLQYWWADNSVSYTAAFTQDEADRGEISRVLSAYDGQMKGISFLKKETTAYAQMPFTPAPPAEVKAYAQQLQPLRFDIDVRDQEDKYCDGGACQITAAA